MQYLIILVAFLSVISTISVVGVFRFYSQLKNEKKQADEKNAQDVQKKETEILEIKEKIRSELEKEYQLNLESVKLSLSSEYQEKQKKLNEELTEIHHQYSKKDESLEQKSQKLEIEREKIQQIKDELREIKLELIEKKETLDKAIQEQKDQSKKKLEEISGLTVEEAKEIIQKKVKESIGSDLLEWQNKYLTQYTEEAHIKAREIVAQAVQRCSSEVANEYTLTSIKLEDDDQKGKIIGKGGRNIQWLEKILGVELIIDETPETIMISGYSSIRRHIAKKTIEMLLKDGRIHPAHIEEMYEKAKAEIAQDIADSGQQAVNDLGIYDFPAKLVRLIGRLKFRTSYGQNMLSHSVEMAKLASLIAHEINATFPSIHKPVDVDICIKAGLLHDIGKALDEETQPRLSHITLGEKICDTFNLDWKIKKSISSHHNEQYYDPEHGFCIEAVIVDACDNISGGRIGARNENAEAYFERMESLEKIADTTPGVTKSWIMRGSRELWVFFDTGSTQPSEVSDIIRAIADRIQTDVKYPGEIKVVGFWENKIVTYAH